MLKSYKYRIYPTPEQVVVIEKTFGCCRLVYNLALEVKKRTYKEHGISLGAYSLINQLVEMKQDNHWLYDVDSQALTASIRRLETAFDAYFKGKGFPKFKSKYGPNSFRSPNNRREVDFEKGTLTIPKLSDIPMVISRKFKGEIKIVTISKTTTGKFYASILVDNKVELPKKREIEPQSTIGIDLGLKHFAILSDGTKFDNPRFLQQSLERLKVLQRRASRKKKGSSNRKKANKKVALLHEKIANQRRDYLQKLSTELVCENQATTFCVESLNIAGMSKRCKPKYDEDLNPLPNGQAAKSGLNKSIRDAGLGMFLQMLEYKCGWFGKNLIKIGRFEPSSKTCSECGAINENLTLSDREWSCASCFVTHDRDVNAAKNIKFMGLKTGEGISGGPAELRTKVRAKKQEYVGA